MLYVKNLSISFSTYLGEVKAVKNISFKVGKKEIVAIVGESGCGKSATANGILGLLSQPAGRITNGEISFCGEDIRAKSKKQMRQLRGGDIGMIFQDPMSSLNPTMRIGRQIAESLALHTELSRKQIGKEVVSILHKVGISDPKKRLSQYPHELSGGMRQRVMIAIAIACAPKLLIADEPTTALDVTIQAQILDLLLNLRDQMGTSMILITHDLGVVAHMADRVLVMHEGSFVEKGEVHDIFSSPHHPYTKGLLKSVPTLEFDRHQQLTPVKRYVSTCSH